MFWYDTLRAAPASWRGVDGRPPGGTGGDPHRAPPAGATCSSSRRSPSWSPAMPARSRRGGASAARAPAERMIEDAPLALGGRGAGSRAPGSRRDGACGLRSEESPTRPHAHGRDW